MNLHVNYLASSAFYIINLTFEIWQRLIGTFLIYYLRLDKNITVIKPYQAFPKITCNFSNQDHFVLTSKSTRQDFQIHYT